MTSLSPQIRYCPCGGLRALVDGKLICSNCRDVRSVEDAVARVNSRPLNTPADPRSRRRLRP